MPVEVGGEQFKIEPPDRPMYFKSASGGVIEHHGKREVRVMSSF